MSQLPKDPVMLLSVVNTNLRDFYLSLNSFCNAKVEDKNEIVNALSAIGYEYNEESNQFK